MKDHHKMYLMATNIRRLRSVALAGVLLNIIVLYMLQPSFEEGFYGLTPDGQLRVLWMILCLVFFLGAGHPDVTEEVSFPKKLFFYTTVMFNMFYTAAMTVLVDPARGVTLLFVIVVMLTGVVLFLHARVFLLMIFPSVLLFFLVILSEMETILNNQINLINIMVITVFSVIISHINFKDKIQYLESVDEINKKNQELEYMAKYDMLTNVINRRKLMELITESWNTIVDKETNIGMIMIDIDHFKLYNDRYGHIAGDRALQKVAASVQEVLAKEGMILGRYGGEEFLAFFETDNQEKLFDTAEAARKAVADLEISHLDSPESILTISAGVAFGQPGLYDTVDNLIEEADHGLYMAKKGGRNNVCVSETLVNGQVFPVG